jgi:hypothetical protein
MKLDIHGQQLWNYPYEYHTETHQLHIVSDSPLTIDTLKQPVSPVYLSRDGELSLCFRQEGTIRCIINSNNTGGLVDVHPLSFWSDIGELYLTYFTQSELVIIKHGSWDYYVHLSSTNVNLINFWKDTNGGLIVCYRDNDRVYLMRLKESEFERGVHMESTYHLNPLTLVRAGDIVHYSFVIHNETETPVSDIIIMDQLSGGPNGQDLMTREVMSHGVLSIPMTYQLTQSDIDTDRTDRNDHYSVNLYNRAQIRYRICGVTYEQTYDGEVYTLGLAQCQLTPYYFRGVTRPHKHVHKHKHEHKHEHESKHCHKREHKQPKQHIQKQEQERANAESETIMICNTGNLVVKSLKLSEKAVTCVVTELLPGESVIFTRGSLGGQNAPPCIEIHGESYRHLPVTVDPIGSKTLSPCLIWLSVPCSLKRVYIKGTTIDLVILRASTQSACAFLLSGNCYVRENGGQWCFARDLPNVQILSHYMEDAVFYEVPVEGLCLGSYEVSTPNLPGIKCT